jgi:hypothetical protein
MKQTFMLFAIILLAISCKSKQEPSNVATPAIDTTKVEIAMPVLTKRWETDTLLKTAESVIFNKTLGVFYVSCIGAVPPDAKDKDGFIAKVDQQGKIMQLKWITGLSGPKGMAIKGDTLFVADITDLVMINITSSKILKKIPIKGAKFLNDVDIDANGLVYISDTGTNSVHSYDGKTVQSFAVNEALGGPNGIYNEGERLVMASFGKGQVYTVNKADQKVEMKVDSFAGGDGVEAFRDGYLISNWNGEVYYIDKEWKKHILLDTKSDKINAADIEFVPSQNLLLVPGFFGNKVTAYDVK